MKKILVEIEDEMKEDFCNVKTIKDSKRILRFWERTLVQCKQRRGLMGWEEANGSGVPRPNIST